MKIFAATDVGIGRANNEDCYAVIDNSTGLVADGMGGYAAGEVASRMISDIAMKELSGQQNIDEKVLSGIIKKANKEIIEASSEKNEYKGMGTTVVMCHCQDGRGFWANVGDSRCYLLRGGMLKQLSKDHSLVGEMVANGTITKDEAISHPKRHMLTRAVGAEKTIKVDVGKLKLKPGDEILMCTDGVTSVLDDDMIKNVLLTAESDPAQALVKKALQTGSLDNITAVVMIINDEERSES